MIDEYDRKLLKALRRDGALTSTALGDLIGLSPSATHRRVKLLEASGMIEGYRARLSREARGSPSIVFVSVTLKDQVQETLSRFEEAIRRCPDIEEAFLMGGDYDYLLKVPVPEGASFERLHRDVLARLPGVHRLVSQFTIRTILEAE